MTVEVHPAKDNAEYGEALQAIGQYFGMQLNDEALERFLKVLPLDRMHAARENGQVVGGAGAFSWDMSIPGGSLPTAGVTVVGVYPTHRRRGVLRAMMRAQLDDAHERGEPLAALWASEETIYGRFGYGIAGWVGQVTIPRVYSGFALPFERRGEVRLVDADEAFELFPPIWAAVRSQRTGMYLRPDDWWRDRVIRDPEERREGAGPKRFIVHELDGKADAYAIYRHKPGFEAGTSTGVTVVVEAMAATPVGEENLWRYLLDIDWAATIEASLLPPDHSLFLLLATPRRAKYRMGDGLWVRLVDAGAALSARSYREGEPVVVELRDAFCDWNEGRWRLRDGSAERTQAKADLVMDADALGSAYLGGVTFAQLRAGSRLEEVTDGAAARADALFGTDLHPWCPEIF
jgi:predicted acetyltransferase